MKTKYFISIILSFITVGLIILIGAVLAQETTSGANIQYPVEELSGCKNETDCRSYCDKPANLSACLDFAEKNNLMSEEEIRIAKNFVAAGAKGPGGCNGKEECEAFCDDIANIDECVSFAEKNNLMPPEELEEAKKVKAAIKRGVKPPPCGNKKACDVYCEESEHMEECVTFGIEAGFIQGKELEDVQKMLSAVKRGIKPPPCRGKEACDEYCSSPDNMEVCMNFAVEAGFMPEEEKANSQKMLQAIKKGAKPPKCRGKEECDTYCSQDDHFEECFQFAEAAGFMSPEEAAMARKTKGKGPGDCRGKEECETFCNNPDNQETCFNFAKENGMIPEEDLKRMEEGKQQFRETMTQMPQETADCLKSSVGEETFEKFKSGTAMPSREIGDKMRECFEKNMGPGPGPGPDGQGRPGPDGTMPQQAGPGGCKNPEECKAYCESNPDKCQKFQPGLGEINPAGRMMPQQAGPGGCKGPEECKVYCESNPDECKNFSDSNRQENLRGPAGVEGEFKEQFKEQFEKEFERQVEKKYNCSSPEECQQLQNRLAPQIIPRECEGENCLQKTLLPGEQLPQNFQAQPIEQQPQQLQQPAPSETLPPLPSTDTQIPPPADIQTSPPPPADTQPPPPVSAAAPKSLLGSILNFFLSLFNR